MANYFNTVPRKKTTNNWRVNCVNVNGVNGFEVTIPNGTKYVFSQPKKVISLKKVYLSKVPTLCSGNCMIPPPSLDAELGRLPKQEPKAEMKNVQVFMQVTAITDRFGNWVKYDYDSNGNLDKIRASDGRLIDVTFSGNRVTSVTANNRTWQYNYAAPSSSSSFYKLSQVIRPDNQHWQFDYHGQYWADTYIGQTYPQDPLAPTSCIAMWSGDYVHITHPNGAVGEFSVAERCLGQSRVPKVELFNRYGQGRPYQNYVLPVFSKQVAINEKTIILPDGTDYTWQYDYGKVPGSFYGEAQQYSSLLMFKFPSSADISFVNHNIAELNSTIEINPDGSQYLSLFDSRYGHGQGNKLYSAVYDEFDNLLTYTAHKHATSPTIYGDSRNWSAPVHSSFLKSIPPEFAGQTSFDQGISGTRVQRLTETKSVLLDSGIETAYQEHFTNFNTYEAPTYITQTGPSGTRNITLGYTSSTSQWILNQPTTVDVRLNSGTTKRLSEKLYHSKSSSSLAYRFNLKEEKWFGATRKSYPTYHTSTGMIGQVKDVDMHETVGGHKRRVTFSNYKRGQAQTVTVPKRYSTGTMQQSKVVDNNGWVTSTTDFNNNTTRYAYNNIGLVKGVDFPSDPTYGNWEDLYFNYNYPSSGGLIRTQYKCVINASLTGCASNASLTTTETYDGLLRLTKTKTSGSGINRYQNFDYDSNNKQIFQSFVSTSATESRGITSKYDALQRLVTSTTSGLGTTSLSYLSGNKIRSTDPKNHSTTTSYRAFSSPSYQLATLIQSPESINTRTNYDLFGNVTSIIQSGNGLSQTESRYYDIYNNLCLVKRNDIGNKRTSFNLLGELIWSAHGDVSSCVSSKPSYAIDFEYDNLGGQHKILFSDSTPDQTHELDNNGNLVKLSTSNVTSYYTYNNLNKVESERISTQYGSNLSVDYIYNPQQHISSTIYPNGHRVYSLPNAFGESTKLYRSGRTYLSNALYHANGMNKSFNLGNGVYHLTTLHPESDLPKQISYTKGGLTVAKHTYEYDGNANITKILDGVNSGYNLNSLVYDGLDRLKSVSGNSLIGSASLSYDTLGNVTAYSNKNRTLTYHYDRTNNRLDSISSYGTKDKDYGYFNYDDRGNITHNSHFAMNYNLGNQMTSANGNTYAYDGHNKRVYAYEKGKTSFSFYSLAGQLLYQQENNVGTNYIYLGNKLVAKDKSGTVTYVHADNLGSPIAETNASGTVLSRMQYMPFGESLETPKDDVGYTGHKFDKDLGLNYMQARYYDPVIGRFYSNDPVGFKNIHNFNRFAYANNNPYKYIDPNGQDAIAIQLDVDMVALPVFGTLAPAGGGLSAGVVVEFDISIPSFEEMAAAIQENPMNPVGAVIDAAVKSVDVGVIGSYRGSAGLDVSAGVSAQYTPGSAKDFAGTSTVVEGGKGPISLTGSSFDTAQGTGIPTTNGSFGFELSVSPLPASGSVSREVTGVIMLSDLK